MDGQGSVHRVTTGELQEPRPVRTTTFSKVEANTEDDQAQEREDPILSISDAAQARFKKAGMKLYTNRVYVPWYRRYVNILPEGQQIDCQPFEEVQKRDEDIALRYMYGDEELEWDIPGDKFAQERRRLALWRYNRMKSKEEAQRAAGNKPIEEDGAIKSVRSIIELNKSKMPDMKEEFGPTITDLRKMNPVIQFLTKLHIRKRRQALRGDMTRDIKSKWNILGNSLVKMKIRKMHQEKVRLMIRARFRRIIQLVCCVYRFINTISIMSGDTRHIFKSVKSFQEEQVKQTLRKKDKGPAKFVFDPNKYKLSKEIPFEMNLKMILTKPWFSRTDSEIRLVVDNLQKLRNFVVYPPSFQLKLARVAWLIEVPKHKVIIRQCHIAQDMYLMLTGKAKMSRLEGNPYFRENQSLKMVSILKKDSRFGDECLAHPGAERTFSVISMEECTMLAINVHDYSKMLMSKRDDERAPEHLRFLIGIKFMKDFPKLKLLEEGDEYISMYYFRSDTVVAKSMEESDYVYVVKSGYARVLAEVPPSHEVLTRYESRRRALNAKKSLFSPPPRLKTPTLSEMMMAYKDQQAGYSNKRKSLAQATEDKLLSDNRLQCHLKQLEQRYNTVSIRNKEKLKAEGAEIQEKAQLLLKTLPRHIRQSVMRRTFTFRPSHLPEDQLPPTGATQKNSVVSSLSKDHRESTVGLSNFRNSTSLKGILSPQPEDQLPPIGATQRNSVVSSFSKDHRELTVSNFRNSTNLKGILSPQRSRLSAGSITAATSITSVKSVNFKVDKEDETRKPSRRDLQVTGSNMEFTETVSKVFQRQTQRSPTLSIDESEEQQLLRSPESPPKVPKIVLSSVSTHSSTENSVGPVIVQKHESADHGQRCSVWKCIKHMVKGDYIGDEWLDYNDGPFEPPETIQSLVSDGCELIMVKKCFLLKCLRKVW